MCIVSRGCLCVPSESEGGTCARYTTQFPSHTFVLGDIIQQSFFSAGEKRVKDGGRTFQKPPLQGEAGSRIRILEEESLLGRLRLLFEALCRKGDCECLWR